MPIGRSSHTNILHSAKTSRNSSNLLSNFTLRNTKMVQFDIFFRRGSLYFYLYCGQSLGLNLNSIFHLLLILCFLCYELPFSVLKLIIFIEKNYQFHIVLEIIRILDEFRRAQCRTREEEENLVAKKTPMAKVEKRQKQEEEAADKMKQAEIEYKAKIDVANQKQNKIKDETSNTARELQVYTDRLTTTFYG